jgi:hypothetical protein
MCKVAGNRQDTMFALTYPECIFQQEGFLTYDAIYRNQQMVCMSEAVRRMQLFAICGAPPGLSNELTKNPKKGGRTNLSAVVDSTPVSSVDQAQKPNESKCQKVAEPERASRSNRIQTSVTIRNLKKCTRQMLLDLLDRQGFEGLYNLVYLPLYFRNGQNFPYAFVKFVSESAALDFQACTHGYADSVLFGDSFADVCWSECQGLQAMIEKFQSRRVCHPAVDDEFSPLLFKDGKIVPLPLPPQRFDENIQKGKSKTSCVKGKPKLK